MKDISKLINTGIIKRLDDSFNMNHWMYINGNVYNSMCRGVLNRVHNRVAFSVNDVIKIKK